MVRVNPEEAAAFERELITEVELLNGTDLDIFGVEITGVTIQGAYPDSVLIIDFIDRRKTTEVDHYPIKLWKPSMVYQDPDGNIPDPASAATEIYAELIEG